MEVARELLPASSQRTASAEPSSYPLLSRADVSVFAGALNAQSAGHTLDGTGCADDGLDG